jgi:hypothetical protein
MRKLRFNIASLLVIILVLGVGFAALRESSDLWESGLFTATLGILLISILLAVHRTEQRRAFWLGFALFGSAYLGLTLMPSIEPRLITTKVLAFLDPRMPPSNIAGLAYFDYDNDGKIDLYVANNAQQNALYRKNGNGTFSDITAVAGLNSAAKQASFTNILARSSLTRSIGTTENFLRIGHSLIVCVAALLGGQLSRYLHSRDRGTALELSSPETRIS